MIDPMNFMLFFVSSATYIFQPKYFVFKLEFQLSPCSVKSPNLIFVKILQRTYARFQPKVCFWLLNIKMPWGEKVLQRKTDLGLVLDHPRDGLLPRGKLIPKPKYTVSKVLRCAKG